MYGTFVSTLKFIMPFYGTKVYDISKFYIDQNPCHVHNIKALLLSRTVDILVKKIISTLFIHNKSVRTFEAFFF